MTIDKAKWSVRFSDPTPGTWAVFDPDGSVIRTGIETKDMPHVCAEFKIDFPFTLRGVSTQQGEI